MDRVELASRVRSTPADVDLRSLWLGPPHELHQREEFEPATGVIRRSRCAERVRSDVLRGEFRRVFGCLLYAAVDRCATRFETLVRTVVVEPVAEKSLRNITIEGHELLEPSDTVEEAIQLVNTNGGGTFRNITIRDCAAEAAYLVEINETDTGGSWDNVVIEDSAQATSEYTSTEIACYVDGGADVGRLSLDNLEAHGNNLLWYDATIDRCVIKNSDLSEPLDAIINKQGGGITRLQGDNNVRGALPTDVSNVIIEDGLGEESAGTGNSPSDPNWEAGDTVENIDDGTIWTLSRDGSTWTQLG